MRIAFFKKNIHTGITPLRNSLSSRVPHSTMQNFVQHLTLSLGKHVHFGGKKPQATNLSSVSFTTLFSSASGKLSWPATTVLLLEVVPVYEK